MRRWITIVSFISFFTHAQQPGLKTLYYVNEFDFISGHPTPQSEIRFKPHIRAEYDALNRLILKVNLNRKSIVVTKVSYTYETDTNDPIQKQDYEGEDRLVRRTLFGLRGKAPKYISYVYGVDSLETWKDDIFTIIDYNEYEKPYFYHFLDVNAVGYANATLEYNDLGWLTREVWKRLPDGKQMRLWTYDFDPQTELTRILEYDSSKTLVMDIRLNQDSLEAVYNPIIPVDSGFVNHTRISVELQDSINYGFITWRWVAGVPDVDSVHVFKMPDSLFERRTYYEYDLQLDNYLTDGGIYDIEFTGESAFEFEIIKVVIRYVMYDITPPTISIGTKPAINKPEFFFTTDEPLSTGYVEWIPFPSSSHQDSIHRIAMTTAELKLGTKQFITLDNQTPLLDSAEYTLQLTAYDRARNSSFFQAEELILYDISPPLVYMYYPLSNTYVNHLEVQIEASEVLASGQIILTDLSGIRDTLSPHVYQLPKKELQLGMHKALLDDALPIMDTTTYSFKFIGIDPASNISDPAIREPIYYDISPPVYTQIYPSMGSHVNNPRLSFIVSEDLAAGEFTWVYREGLKDTAAPHVIALVSNERKGDTRTNWMLKNQTELSDGTIYDLIFIGQDLAGNQTGFITTPEITYDITLPVFAILDPVNEAFVNYLTVSYEISEPLREGTITWTALNPVKDPESPRIISINREEMIEGVYADVLLANMTNLIDSVTYNLEMKGADLATNEGIPSKVTSVHYDFSPPIITLTHPANNTYQAKTFLNYELSEDILYGQVSWLQLYTRGVTPDTVMLQGNELLAGLHDTTTFAAIVKLKDGASYDLIFDAYDLAKNEAVTGRISNVTYDFTPPEIELQYPATLAAVNNTNLSYFISEFLLEATATWTWVDGVLDMEDHIHPLEPFEREPGEKQFIMLTNAPDLVDGAYYDVTIYGKDRAGNPSNLATAKNVKYDVTQPVITITNPGPDVFITSTQTAYDLSEDMGSITVRYEYSGGDYDLGSPHISSISGDDLKIGAHNIEPEFTPELMEGTQYTLTVSGVDLAGNAAQPAVVLGVVYDANPPVLALNAPMPESFIKETRISYSINESLAEATLLWEAIAGADDPNAPHRITFTEEERKKGTYIDTILIAQTTLQDSTVYRVSFFGMDPASNESNLVINDRVTFDISRPILTIIEPGNNHYTPSTNINYSTSEDLRSAKIIYVGTSAERKRLTAEVTISPEGLTAGVHNSDDYAQADLRDSSTYMIGFEAQDLAGNFANPVGLYNFHVDRTLPVFSDISPQSNAYSNNPLFEFTLSEDLYYGKVTFTEQSGSLNPGTKVEFEMDSVDFSQGFHPRDTLGNQLPLVDGAVYTIQLAGRDIANNWNDTTLITNYHYDITSPITAILDPLDSSFVNTNAVTISNSEPLLAAEMFWINPQGDAKQVALRTRDLAVGENRLIMYTISLDENTHYDLLLNIIDLAGNAIQTRITEGIIYDVTLPILTINKPTNGGYINNKAVSYTISEPLIQAAVTWEIKTGIDTLSPHRIELAEDDMTAGVHDSTLFSILPDITDGSWYDLTMAGIDRAGNQAEINRIRRVKYDFTYPIFSDLKPDANEWINKLDLAYTISEDLIFGRIVFNHVGGEPDPDGEYLVRLSGSRLKAGPGGGRLPRSMVRLISGGIYTITYTGRDSAGNFVSEFIIPNVRFDEIKPFVVITKPMASETVFDSFKWPYANSEKVNYTLSEDLREASITIVNTGGKLDSRSPIEIQLTKDEMQAGSYLETILNNSVNLIDSSVYTYSLNGIDSARNVADTFTVSDVHFDITKPVIDLIEPAENGALNAALISYDYSETMLQSDLTITHIGGTPDTLSPHNVEVVMYELAAGRVDSAIITNAPALIDGAIYRYEFKGVDLANNESNVIVADNVLFDNTAPVVSMTRPIDSEILNTVDISFMNSENLHRGDFIFTRGSGTSDSGSPHSIALLDEGLKDGMHTDWMLAFEGNLVDGTRYVITFDGNDRAGNKAEFTSIGNVLYDINPPVVIVEYPVVQGFFNAPKFTYSTNEQLREATITLQHIGGPADPNSPHTVEIPTTFRFEGFYQEVNFSDQATLVDGAMYDITIVAMDMANNVADPIEIPGVTHDITPPVFSVIEPVENGYYFDLVLNYNLSEPLGSGTVTLERTRGTYDSTSPYTIELQDLQLTTLEDAVADLDKTLPLKSGSGYDIGISVFDRAGNPNEPILIENVTYDTIPPAIAILAPSAGDYINYRGLSYSTNESLREFELVWTRTGGTADPDAPHKALLPETFLPQGRYENIRLTEVPILVNNTVYTMTLIATDLGGNKTSRTVKGVIYDDIVPEFVVTIPVTGGSLKAPVLSYKLDEILSRCTIIWEPVSVADDSTHNVVLKDMELSLGVFNKKNFINQSALVDGVMYRLLIDAADRAENELTVVLADSVTYDTTLPVFLDVVPAAGGYVNSAVLQFTNSEILQAGSVTWLRTDGEADGGSPHTMDIPAEYFGSGPQETINIAAPNLVNGTIYQLTLNSTDKAGNMSVTTVLDNVHFDTEAPAVVIIYPPDRPAINNTDVGYELSEHLREATFTYTWLSGPEDSGSPHTLNLDSRKLQENTVNRYPLSPAPFLIDGATYKIEFSGNDRAGNIGNVDVRESILYDITKPIITMLIPAADKVIIGQKISYSISEDLEEGSLTWVRSGGNSDDNAPHTIQMTESEKETGDHDAIVLQNSTELMSSTTYTVTLRGTDPAGNENDPALANNVDYVRPIDGQWIFEGAVITVIWNFTTTAGSDGTTGEFEQWIQMGKKVSNREKGSFTLDYSSKPWTLSWSLDRSGIRRISLFEFGDNEILNVITGETKPESWEDGQIMQYKYTP